MVRPVNSETSVKSFFKLFKDNKKLNVDPFTIINVTQRSDDMPIPYNLSKPFTLYQCAKYYWDLNVNIEYINDKIEFDVNKNYTVYTK